MRTIRIVENNRLVYYKQQATKEYWDQVWVNSYNPNIFKNAEAGHLSLAKQEQIFLKYLPKTGKILEAGCGRGQVVLALQSRGYDIEGVKWGEHAVLWANENYPKLSIKVGDVTQLDVPDNYYSGYISLGVIEHRHEGPEPFLQEAHRVLKPGGVALISVPYFHWIRRIKGRIGFYRESVDELEFYQQAFTKSDYAKHISNAGFSIITLDSTNVVKGLKDEVNLFNILVKHKLSSRIFKKIVRSISPIHQNFGHMLMAICTKPN